MPPHQPGNTGEVVVVDLVSLAVNHVGRLSVWAGAGAGAGDIQNDASPNHINDLSLGYNPIFLKLRIQKVK